MANIRINQLPEELAPIATDVLPVDSTLGGTTRKVPLPNLADIIRPVASEPEAEAGADNTKTMTPLRTKQQIDTRIPQTPLSAGAVGDGTANDTTAFALLELTAPATNIDLLGRVYLVNAEPLGAQYYNGAFKVGSTILTRPNQPLAHPLAGQVTVSPTAVGGLQHPWVGPQGVFSDDRKVRVTAPDSTRHESDPGGRLLLESSFSGGASWIEPRVIEQYDNYDPRGLVGGMTAAGSRFVVVWLNQDAAGSPGDMYLSYVTSGGAPVVATLATGGDVFYPHGDVIEDSSGNLHIFGVRGSTQLCRASLVWNGSGYTTAVAVIATIGVGSIAEPVAFLTTSGWVFLIRNDAGGNAYGLSCNTDFSSPSAFADSKVPLGLNPAAGVKAWGRGHFYLAARRSTPILGYQNAILHAAVDLDALWTASGIFPNNVAWSPVVRMDDFGLGYLTITPLRGGYWEGLYNEGESLVGTAVASSARIVRIGGLPIATSVPASVASRRTFAPMHYNAGLQHWTRGTTFTAPAGVATKTADGLIVRGSGADVTVTREVVPETLRDRLAHRPYYCARVVSASGGSGRYISRRVYGREQMEAYARQVVRANAQWEGDSPGYFRFGLTANFGGGGSTSEEVYVDTAQSSDGTDDMVWLSEYLSMPSIDGKTWGTLPYMEFYFLSNGAGALDIRLYGLWADPGADQISLWPPNLANERLLIDPHIQARNFGEDELVAITSRVSDDVGLACVPVVPSMVRAPVISLATGTTAANFYVGSAPADTLANLTFADGLPSGPPPGPNAYRLRAERTGAFTAATQEVRCVSSGAIVLDAEPTP